MPRRVAAYRKHRLTPQLRRLIGYDWANRIRDYTNKVHVGGLNQITHAGGFGATNQYSRN